MYFKYIMKKSSVHVLTDFSHKRILGTTKLTVNYMSQYCNEQ